MASFVIIELLLLLYNLVSNSRILKSKISPRIAKEILFFGLGSYISEITSVVNTSMDVIIVGYILNSKEAGSYSFIVYFIKTLYIFPGILMQNLSPVIAQHWARRTISELNNKLNKLRRVNVVILLLQSVMLIILFIAASYFFKDELSNHLGIFAIALIGSLLFASISWGGSILIMTGKLRANFFRTSSVLLLNILSFGILTSAFGITGSAVAIAFNGLSSFLLLRGFIHHQTGIKLI